MRNFQGIVFISTQIYREIVKSALCTFKVSIKKWKPINAQADFVKHEIYVVSLISGWVLLYLTVSPFMHNQKKDQITLKTFRCKHLKILKVCLTIFPYYAWKGKFGVKVPIYE